MKKHLKKYFIPHAENNYHPHILHTKRTILYAVVFLAVKVFIVAFVMLLPVHVFVLPDVLAEEQKQIIRLTNEVRVKNGQKALVEASKLDLSAQHKAVDMAQKEYFAHTEGKRSLSDWLHGVNYKYNVAGENLAVGFSSAAEIVDAWVESPTHFANLIDKDFKDLGVGLEGGVYDGEPTVYVVQHFASPLVLEEPKPVAKVVETPKKVAVKPVKSPVKVAVGTTPPEVLSEKISDVKREIAPIVKTGQPTPVEKYIQAKNTLSPVTNIFEVSKIIFLVAAIFFAVALALKIFIEIRKQHPHVIVQTVGLIGLLVFLYKF